MRSMNSVIWSKRLASGDWVHTAELQTDVETVKLEVRRDIDSSSMLWGVRFPAKRKRIDGLLQLVRPEYGRGGKVRIEDESGDLDYARSLALAKEEALDAATYGRPKKL